MQVSITILSVVVVGIILYLIFRNRPVVQYPAVTTPVVTSPIVTTVPGRFFTPSNVVGTTRMA